MKFENHCLTQYRPVQDASHSTGYRTPHTIQASVGNRTEYRTPYTIQASIGHLTQYRPVQDTSHSGG